VEDHNWCNALDERKNLNPLSLLRSKEITCGVEPSTLPLKQSSQAGYFLKVGSEYRSIASIEHRRLRERFRPTQLGTGTYQRLSF
jgi:hypothetical protein